MKSNDPGWLPSPADYPSTRLFCLDLLRGLDMFILVVLHDILYWIGKLCGASDGWFYHLSHPWGGFSFWDVIMPCFIFMCGAAIPLSVGRRFASGEPKSKVWMHVLLRFAMLWFFGMLTQGRLATLDVMRISPYNNTLQTIAAGYLIAVLVRQIRWRGAWIAATALLALVYTLLIHFLGDYSAEGNFAHVVEVKILACLVPAKSEAFSLGGYTWFLTTLMFGAMTLCGMLATDLLTSGLAPWRKAGALAAYGAGLLAVGFAVEPVIPCIKQFFTLSFTAQAMGYCVLALAALYVLTDIWRLRRGTGVLLLYGQCALAAYMLSHFFRPFTDGLVKVLAQGLPHLLGGYAGTWMPLVNALVYGVVITFLVAAHRRLKILKARSRAV